MMPTISVEIQQKASHAILMCRMEQGEVNDYTKTDKIDRIRRANAQKYLNPSSEFLQNSKFKKTVTKATSGMQYQ